MCVFSTWIKAIKHLARISFLLLICESQLWSSGYQTWRPMLLPDELCFCPLTQPHSCCSFKKTECTTSRNILQTEVFLAFSFVEVEGDVDKTYQWDLPEWGHRLLLTAAPRWGDVENQSSNKTLSGSQQPQLSKCKPGFKMGYLLRQWALTCLTVLGHISGF